MNLDTNIEFFIKKRNKYNHKKCDESVEDRLNRPSQVLFFLIAFSLKRIYLSFGKKRKEKEKIYKYKIYI
jgi:hypothetical protein